MTHSVRVWAAAFAVAYAASLTTVFTQVAAAARGGDVASHLRRPRQPAVLERQAAGFREPDRVGHRRAISAWNPATPGGRINAASSRTRSRRAPATSSSASRTISKRFCRRSRTTRSSYVIAHRKGGHAITSLDAPELKTLRIGVYANTPVEESLARRGLVDHLTAYSLFFDPTGDRDRPAKLLDDLVAGTVDVALPWGPLAGYYAKKLNAPIEMSRRCPSEEGVPLVVQHQHGREEGQSRSQEPSGSGDRPPADGDSIGPR